MVVIPTAVTPVLGVALGVLLDPWVAVASLPAAGVLGGVGAYAGRRTLTDQREQARRALRSFLDEIEELGP